MVLFKKPCLFCHSDKSIVREDEIDAPDGRTCPVCKGKRVNFFRMSHGQRLKMCEHCKGTGCHLRQGMLTVTKEPCRLCDGKGWRIVDV
jgi:DnaJ-class molecular chaperone